MSTSAYRSERDALLARLTSLLEQDSRVVAAWLFGSLGRGSADDLSDIDLMAVVTDEYIPALVAGRREYAGRAGKPVLFVEAPQNAPEGGGYLMIYYASPPGPLQVDWYWQPESTAAIPSDARMLFDRVGLSRQAGPTIFTARPGVSADTARPMHFIGFFWAMLLITAKYAARSPRAEHMELLRYVLPGLNQARACLGLAEPAATLDDLPAHRDFAEKVALLRRLADDMSRLMPAIAARGEPVPDEMVPAVYRYLDLIERAPDR
jgi:hypothetical protein